MKEARHIRPYIVWFCVYEMFKEANLQRQKVDAWLAKAGSLGEKVDDS